MRCHRTRFRNCITEQLELRVVVEDNYPYIAFSHVWADGLGNPHTNALPRCQLRRLRDHATELDRIHNLASTSESADLPVALWLDTLCIPVNPSAKAYRKKAIQLLGKTFNEADAVLALDHTSHVMFVFVRRTFQFARPTSKRSRAMQTFVKTLAGLFRNDSNKSIANSIPVETLELKVLFTVQVTSEDNKIHGRSEHQQYLVKNLLVEAGNMVKVIWEANEKYYLGVRGEDFGYFLQAGAHKRDLDESQETPEPRKSKFRQSLGRRRPHFVKTSAARQMELPPSPSAPDDILGGDRRSRRTSDPKPSSHGGDTFRGVLLDHSFQHTRIFGRYILKPQPESGGKFHHLMAVELTLATPSHTRFSSFILDICFDIGIVDNVTARGDQEGYTQTSFFLEPHVSTAPNICSGNKSSQASWKFREDQAGSGLQTTYLLQLEVDSKPLFVGYSLCTDFKDDHKEANRKFKASEMCCLYESEIRRRIP
ncbi:hypothetical protein F5887DRAFT_1073429 [Amanita rubescens]|nr:hypothetical protein F5887DRAFT_1073429 [Amanita rubescens]